MYIYNDYGVVKFTFKYYAVNGGSIASKTKTGVIRYTEQAGIMFNFDDGMNWIPSINIDVTQQINSLNIKHTLTVIAGVYARV